MTSRWNARRLHTITGAIVLAAFLVEHLLTNASVLGGARQYDRVVGAMMRSPLLPLVEVVFIIVPLAYHAIYGVMLLRRPPDDAVVARYGGQRFWVVQRITATVALVFVLGHFWELRMQRLFFGMSPDATFTVLTAHLSWTWAGVPWVALLYLAGIGAVCVHAANGLFAASALRGWATPRMRILTVAFGCVLFTIGLVTVLGFATGTRLSATSEANTAACGADVPPAVAPASSRP